jgi:hypothetical protein
METRATADPAPEKEPVQVLAENLHTEAMPERVPTKQEQASGYVTPLCKSLDLQPPVDQLPRVVVR